MATFLKGERPRLNGLVSQWLLAEGAGGAHATRFLKDDPDLGECKDNRMDHGGFGGRIMKSNYIL